MHQIFFVTVNKDESNDSEQIQQEANDILDRNGFSGEGGYYSACKADYHGVGGRYSGTFQMAMANKEMKDEQAWKDVKGKEVDAVEFTEELHKQLKHYMSNSYYTVEDIELFDDEDGEEYKLFTDDVSHLYGKWIVVIDYHY